MDMTNKNWQILIFSWRVLCEKMKMEGGKYDKFNYVPKKMIAQLQFLGALEIDWFAFGRRQLAISTSIAKIIEMNIIWEPISSKCKPVFPIQGFSTTMRRVKIIFIYPRFVDK